MRKNFIRQKEDFVCEHCGTRVAGTGYTNHCPQCLWSKHGSKHVDERVPGDRVSSCGGMMEPITVGKRGEGWVITHRCQKCGKEMRNQTAREDNFEELLWLVSGE